MIAPPEKTLVLVNVSNNNNKNVLQDIKIKRRAKEYIPKVYFYICCSELNSSLRVVACDSRLLFYLALLCWRLLLPAKGRVGIADENEKG